MKSVVEEGSRWGVGSCSFRSVRPGWGSWATRGAGREERPGSQGRSTIVTAKVELGPNNAVFIRGQGGGLRWDKGRPLSRTGAECWVWSADAPGEKIEFQLLLDDQVWARGENLVLRAGERIELTPDFEWPEIPRTS